LQGETGTPAGNGRTSFKPGGRSWGGYSSRHYVPVQASGSLANELIEAGDEKALGHAIKRFFRCVLLMSQVTYVFPKKGRSFCSRFLPSGMRENRLLSLPTWDLGRGNFRLLKPGALRPTKQKMTAQRYEAEQPGMAGSPDGTAACGRWKGLSPGFKISGAWFPVKNDIRKILKVFREVNVRAEKQQQAICLHAYR